MFVCIILLAAGTAHAQQEIQVQGRLVDSQGQPVQGATDMTLRLFSQPMGGTVLFGETHAGGDAVTVSDGIYSVTLGSGTTGGIPESAFQSQDLYLEIQVGADPSMTPTP